MTKMNCGIQNLLNMNLNLLKTKQTKLFAQKQSPSISVGSQEATEEEAKEENNDKETKSNLIFPAAIK